MKKEWSKKGFSLIELLVVVAILGILGMVIAPNVLGHVEKSRRSADYMNGALLANAMLRAVAEGYTLKESNSDQSPIKDDIVEGMEGDKSISLDTYIQSIPSPKEDGYDKFTYTYDSNGILKIFKTKEVADGDKGVEQVYPYEEE